MSITTYFKEVRAEMKHVSWPTRRQVVVYTAVVIGISLAVAVYLGLLDYVFAELIKLVI
ncbi:MAG: preprotein translocase subunit SecE [Patescibacteria group bacterium]